MNREARALSCSVYQYSEEVYETRKESKKKNGSRTRKWTSRLAGYPHPFAFVPLRTTDRDSHAWILYSKSCNIPPPLLLPPATREVSICWGSPGMKCRCSQRLVLVPSWPFSCLECRRKFCRSAGWGCALLQKFFLPFWALLYFQDSRGRINIFAQILP